MTPETLPSRIPTPSLLCFAALCAGLLVLGGCASTPPAPNQALQAATLAISNADRDRVAEYAAPELTEARAKLAAAHASVRQEQMIEAERLAKQARADAELASAKADLAQAKLVNDELQKSIDALNEEMQRNQERRQ